MEAQSTPAPADLQRAIAELEKIETLNPGRTDHDYPGAFGEAKARAFIALVHLKSHQSMLAWEAEYDRKAAAPAPSEVPNG